MIRGAGKNDAAFLTDLSFRSKAYWQYPADYFDIWRDELTVTPDYIAANILYVFEDDRTGQLAGYYSLVFLAEDLVFSGGTLGHGWWLEHMFVDPGFIRRTIGTQLFYHLQQVCRNRGIDAVGILSDPNARGFYEKMGCIYRGEYASTIPGRTTPYLECRIKNQEMDDAAR